MTAIRMISLVGLFALMSIASAKNFGAIKVGGVGKTVYVVGPDWSKDFVSVHDNGFTLNGGGRIYFSQDPADDFSNPNMYWQTPLLGRHFSYEIDVSKVGCHCNSAAYFIQMPGYNSGQTPEPGPGGDYYCDANHGNNIWCPEYDTWEGNKFTMASTLHTCKYKPPKYYEGCDGGGCQTNAFHVNSKLMCPEDRCTINTQKPFTVSHSQANGGSGGTMDNVNVGFSQGDKKASFNVCEKKPDYVKNMGYSLKGIVFSASLWGGPDINMDWLDGMTGCHGKCNLKEASVTFKNFRLVKNLG